MINTLRLTVRKNPQFWGLVLFLGSWIILLLPQVSSLWGALFDGGSLFRFYPLIFLPLYCKQKNPGLTLFDWFQITGCFLILIISKISGISTGLWISAVWIGLTLLGGMGISIHLFGKMLFLFIPPFNAGYTLVLGFSLRLFLTRMAGSILSFFDPGLVVEGNMVRFLGRFYTVDPACEGLKMGLALCIVVMFFLYHLYPVLKLSARSLLIYGVSLIFFGLLWLFANLVRIIILIFANIGADAPAHSLIGIITFICIVLFPLLIVREIILSTCPPVPAQPGDQNRSDDGELNSHPRNRTPIFSLAGLMVFGAALLFIPVRQVDSHGTFPHTIGQFTLEQNLDTHSSFGKDYTIGTYTSEDGTKSLIIKNNLYPLRLIHHPRQCWEGAGYQIIKENIVELENQGKVHYALLQKGREQYQLYWWYQSAAALSRGLLPYQTIESELTWRKNFFLQGVTYYQVNLLIPGQNSGIDNFFSLRGAYF